jgi:hypothetical protein
VRFVVDEETGSGICFGDGADGQQISAVEEPALVSDAMVDETISGSKVSRLYWKAWMELTALTSTASDITVL